MTEEEYSDEISDSEDENTIKIDKIYIMYKIQPKNNDLFFSYIGHTADFSKRCEAHKRNTTNIKDRKHYHLKVYQTIRDNGGWDEWEIIELEKYICNDKMKARMREQELMFTHNTNLNTCKAFITEDERKKKKQEITNKYKAEHVELIKEQQQQYKQDHKDVIKEQMRKYRQENKAETYEKQKEYKKLHAEKYKENDKIWREANKEINKEKRKIATAKKKAKLLEEQQQLKEINN
jgi:hypothetical protein